MRHAEDYKGSPLRQEPTDNGCMPAELRVGFRT